MPVDLLFLDRKSVLPCMPGSNSTRLTLMSPHAAVVFLLRTPVVVGRPGWLPTDGAERCCLPAVPSFPQIAQI